MQNLISAIHEFSYFDTILSSLQILSFPSAFTVPTGSAGHWYALLKARAIENQCYVIAAAQTGKHNAKRSSYGHSCIIDPWGTIIAECPEGENLIVAEISMEKINTVQTEMPVDKHKRSDLYALATTGEVHIPEESFDETTIHFGQHENSGKCVVLQSRSKIESIYFSCNFKQMYINVNIIGISATMCHSAEKIPAKTGMPDHSSLHIFLHITYRANIGTTRRYTVGALVFPQVPRGTLKGLHSKKN